jgi:hypothetical protein
MKKYGKGIELRPINSVIWYLLFVCSYYYNY